MTQTGHLLTGAAIGLLSLPEDCSSGRALLQVSAFALLATLPDWPFPNWGHDRYYFSHSLFVNLLLILLGIVVIGTWSWRRRPVGIVRILALGPLAILSHLLLDSFYNHGLGIAIYWPFSQARLVLPISWLSLSPTPFPPLTLAHFRVFAFEFITFSPLILIAWLVKRTVQKATRAGSFGRSPG